jgi:2-polyprenyl-3-methyl-5-hydroxy-6-metoxy-1,4-benzoquinol methylase
MAAASLQHRHRIDERMDDPSIDPREHDRALAGLERLNRWSRSHWLLWPWLVDEARTRNARGEALRVLDVATGSGDAPLALARRARAAGLSIEWTLADRSTHVLEVAARRAHEAGVAVRLVEADLFAGSIAAERHDVVTCSLFLHHCGELEAPRALRAMADAAEHAVLLTDLERSRPGLLLAWAGSRVLTRSPVVHFDAVASVRGAFTLDEARAIADSAGLAGARFERTWPARWRMCWRRA